MTCSLYLPTRAGKEMILKRVNGIVFVQCEKSETPGIIVKLRRNLTIDPNFLTRFLRILSIGYPDWGWHYVR